MNRVVLDVSAEEAPEPLLRAIQELERLPQDSYLHLIHRMAPCKLYDYLEQNGFHAETRRGEGGLCELFICHDSAAEVQALIAQLVEGMALWS